MTLRTRKVSDFSIHNKNTDVHGDNTVHIKGGSVAIDDTWVQFKGTILNIQNFIEKYISSSPRLFNKRNGILYILIAINKSAQLEVIPSISFNKTSSGDVKVFPNLSGKLPIMVVKLIQDGSFGLTGINKIRESDIEQYLGYGNFTIKGPEGLLGSQGNTGLQGLTGISGLMGYPGPQGVTGETGLLGLSVNGPQGPRGNQGVSVPTFIPTRYVLPITDFIADPLTGVAPLSVSFTDITMGNPISWSWNFGDGNTSSSQNPTHIYSAGTYTVSLITNNLAGTDQEIKFDYIVVSDPLSADFTVTPTIGDERETLFFFDASSSTGVITSYSWDFGDTLMASGQTTSHVYFGVSGTISITLTITGPSGTDSITKTITVDSYFIQDTADGTVDAWQDSADSSESNIQDSVEE
jgi:PKD repeat protein